MALIMATGKPLPKFIPSFSWFLEGVTTKGFGKGKLYETAVAEAVRGIGVGGGFAVFIDESHADHRFSKAALETVLDHMEAP